MILQILTLPHSEKVYKNKVLLNSRLILIISVDILDSTF